MKNKEGAFQTYSGKFPAGTFSQAKVYSLLVGHWPIAFWSHALLGSLLAISWFGGREKLQFDEIYHVFQLFLHEHGFTRFDAQGLGEFQMREALNLSNPHPSLAVGQQKINGPTLNAVWSFAEIRLGLRWCIHFKLERMCPSHLNLCAHS